MCPYKSKYVSEIETKTRPRMKLKCIHWDREIVFINKEWLNIFFNYLYLKIIPEKKKDLNTWYQREILYSSKQNDEQFPN